MNQTIHTVVGLTGTKILTTSIKRDQNAAAITMTINREPVTIDIARMASTRK